MEHLLAGLSEVSGTDLSDAGDSDYKKILTATKYYLYGQGIASKDDLRFELLAEGIAYSLYSKTGLQHNEPIDLQALSFSFKENAELVKEVYVQAELLAQEIEDAYKNKQELGNQYEEVSNYVEYLFEQYSPYMWWVLLASAGVWSIAIGVMIAIAKKNDEKEKAKKMLVNYVIGWL